MMEYEVHCSDASATESCGQQIGGQLCGGEVIELVGDVGTGKTTFVRGLAKGVGSSDHVSSPTFVLSKVYNGRLTLHHLDLYRVGESGVVARQLAELIEDDSQAVIAVEWADSAKNVLPDERIIIRFEVRADERRRLSISIPEKWDYITC